MDKIIAVYEYEPRYLGDRLFTTHELVSSKEGQFNKAAYIANDDGSIPECTIVAVRTSSCSWEMREEGQMELGI